MTPKTYSAPSQAEIDRIVAEAHVARAAFLAAAFHSALHWAAHPSFHAQHA